MGTCPSWYRTIQAARYLGVAPWDLAGQPLAWVRMAEEAQAADAHAEAVRSKQQGRQAH